MWALAVIMVKCPGNDDACIMKYATTDPNVDYLSDMCDADKNAAWRNFRQMFLEAKHTLVFNTLINTAPGCVPTDHRRYGSAPPADAIYSAKHAPEFTDSKTARNRAVGDDPLQSVNGPTDADNAYGQNECISQQ